MSGNEPGGAFGTDHAQYRALRLHHIARTVLAPWGNGGGRSCMGAPRKKRMGGLTATPFCAARSLKNLSSARKSSALSCLKKCSVASLPSALIGYTATRKGASQSVEYTRSK